LETLRQKLGQLVAYATEGEISTPVEM
jgi:hypothetical protein